MTITEQKHTIRLLNRDDGQKYQQLRLESLQQNPESFLSTYQNESHLPEKSFANHVEWAYHPPHFGYFGIFVEGDLAGYVQVAKTFLEKQEHIACINNLYISPRFRGRGLAKELFQYIHALLAKDGRVERLYLTCAAKNKPAQKLYQKMGFRRYGVKSKSIKWDNTYDDEVEMVFVFNRKFV
jgi:ribosomal protein S18 acetylase RimI-like enzyme